MLLADRNGYDNIVATAREVYDVTGAGDTVSAFLGFMAASGQTYPTGAQVANLAAGVAVSRLGTATVTIEDVLHELEDSVSGSGKIMTREELPRCCLRRGRTRRSCSPMATSTCCTSDTSRF